MGTEFLQDVMIWLNIGESPEVKQARETAQGLLRQHEQAYGEYFHIFSSAQDQRYKKQHSVVAGLLAEKKYAQAQPELKQLGVVVGAIRGEVLVEIDRTKERIRTTREKCRTLPGGKWHQNLFACYLDQIDWHMENNYFEPANAELDDLDGEIETAKSEIAEWKRQKDEVVKAASEVAAPEGANELQSGRLNEQRSKVEGAFAGGVHAKTLFAAKQALAELKQLARILSEEIRILKKSATKVQSQEPIGDSPKAPRQDEPSKALLVEDDEEVDDDEEDEEPDDPINALCDVLDIDQEAFEADCPADEVDTLLKMMVKVNELVDKRDELKRTKGSTSQVDKKLKTERQKIRSYYAKLEKNPPPEPEPEPPPPQETATQKAARIDTLKKTRRSSSALITLNAEGEIYQVHTKFTGRKGKKHKVGIGAIDDFCDGYEVHLRNGPNGERYLPMLVHVHYSDEARTKVERAHFKLTHGANDHNHVLVRTADVAQVLSALGI